VLVRLIKLLAPFTPFVTEVMYQNLVRAVQADALDSIHHCDWPEPDGAMIDEELLGQMAVTRQVASLGLGARASVNIKVRQPLAKALVHLADTKVHLTDEMVTIIADELNVKEVCFVQEESELVSYRLVGDGRLLGPRLGGMFPKVRAALARVEPTDLVGRKRAGLPISLDVDDETVDLAPEEVLVETEAAEGLAVGIGKGITVAVDVVLTPELQAEGLVRDLVRHIQTLRKEADYRLDERITVGLFGLDQNQRAAVQPFEDYLTGETLCSILLFEDDGQMWDRRVGVKLVGSEIEIAVRNHTG
jgi:isoleucyl-tRNA synthetase